MSEFDPQWPAISGGARQRAADVSDLRFEFAAASEPGTAALEKLVEAALARKPVAICLHVTDAEQIKPFAERIIKDNVRLVTMGTPVEGLTPFAHVGVNWPGGAEVLAANLDRIAAGRISYLLLDENGRSETATRCYERFSATAGRLATLRLLEERAAQTPETAQEQIQIMLRRFPNAGLVVTLTPQPWLAMRPRFALEPKNRVATLGAVPPLWLRLRSGEAAALVGALDGEIGRTAVALVLQNLTGEVAFGTTRWIECELVTLSTLDDFARRYAEAANLNVADLLPPNAVPVTAPAALPPSP